MCASPLAQRDIRLNFMSRCGMLNVWRASRERPAIAAKTRVESLVPLLPATRRSCCPRRFPSTPTKTCPRGLRHLSTSARMRGLQMASNAPTARMVFAPQALPLRRRMKNVRSHARRGPASRERGTPCHEEGVTGRLGLGRRCVWSLLSHATTSDVVHSCALARASSLPSTRTITDGPRRATTSRSPTP
jgi:hypothetical protein